MLGFFPFQMLQQNLWTNLVPWVSEARCFPTPPHPTIPDTLWDTDSCPQRRMAITECLRHAGYCSEPVTCTRPLTLTRTL